MAVCHGQGWNQHQVSMEQRTPGAVRPLHLGCVFLRPSHAAAKGSTPIRRVFGVDSICYGILVFAML